MANISLAPILLEVEFNSGVVHMYTEPAFRQWSEMLQTTTINAASECYEYMHKLTATQVTNTVLHWYCPSYS